MQETSSTQTDFFLQKLNAKEEKRKENPEMILVNEPCTRPNEEYMKSLVVGLAWGEQEYPTSS